MEQGSKNYYYSKTIAQDFEKTVERAAEELRKEGFGILTEIDVKTTLKEKINVDFKKYRILGACNPALAHKALQAEDKIGLMLPCNLVVIDQGPGKTEVAAIDPAASMQAVNNEELLRIAEEVGKKLERVIKSI